MRVGIVGLGLIGGSLAKALSAQDGFEVSGVDADENVIRAALQDGVIQRNDLTGCDVVFVCLHPRAAIAWMKDAKLRAGTVVADTCGVKRAVRDGAKDALAQRGLRYVGTHPMAGREVGGYSSSLPNLFAGCSWIITRDSDTDPAAVQVTEKVIRAAGAGNVPLSTAEEHDRIIAYTSQMAHVVSNAYVKNEAALQERGFSAGSFQDLTRVARLDADMWTELFIANADDLIENLDEFIDHLRIVRDAIHSGDEKQLRTLLAEGSDRRVRLTQMESAVRAPERKGGKPA